MKDNNLKMGGKKRISTRVLGKFQLSVAAYLINPLIKEIIPFVDHELKLEMDEKLKLLFGKELISVEKSLIEMGSELIKIKN